MTKNEILAAATSAQRTQVARTEKDIIGTGSKIRLSIPQEGFVRITETPAEGDRMAFDIYPDGAVSDPFYV